MTCVSSKPYHNREDFIIFHIQLEASLDISAQDSFDMSDTLSVRHPCHADRNQNLTISVNMHEKQV